MSSTDTTPEVPHAGVSHSEATGWVAWILLGAVLLLLLGVLHVMTGLVALLRPQVLASTRSDLVLPVEQGVLAWFHVALGAVLVIVGLGLLRGRRWARAAAIVLACLAILVNFAFVGVYPVWAVTAIALAAIVIYATAAHGQELADAYSGP